MTRTKPLIHGQFLGPILREMTTSSFRVKEVGQARDGPIPWHSHESPHFCVVLRGRYTTESRSESQVYGPMTIVYNPADTTHRDRISQPGGTCLMLSLRQHLVHELHVAMPIPRRPLCLQDRQLAWVGARLCREWRSLDVYTPLSIESLGLEIVAQVARRSRAHRSREPSWIQYACRIIQERFAENLTISEVAAEIGVHPVYLARRFREFRGCSPVDYARQVRIRMATELMLSTDRPLAEIALDAGFCDQSSFTQAFRRHTGLTPGNFRSSRPE